MTIGVEKKVCEHGERPPKVSVIEKKLEIHEQSLHECTHNRENG